MASQERRKAGNGALIGAGGTAAGAGLIGGGIPGFKSDSAELKNLKTGNFRHRAGSLLSSGRGGVFGYRADAHQGFLNDQLKDEAAHGGKPTTRQNHYWRGVGSGKIKPEQEIIRHMKTGKKVSGLALAGGTAAAAYGAHRSTQKVHKAQKPHSDATTASTALLAGGSTAAGGSYGAARVLEHQGRKWNRRAEGSYAEAAKLVPRMKGSKTHFDPRLTANHRVGRVSPIRSNDKIGNEANTFLTGKSKVQAEAAGRIRGRAAQEGYFGHVYGKTARMARKVPKPALALAAVGAGGVALSTRKKDVKKSYNPRMSAFGVEH
jgi:hypothetical protein